MSLTDPSWHTRAANKKTAFTLVEVLLALTIFTLFSVAVVSLSIDTLNRDTKVEIENEALHYAQEGLEAARAIRSQDYWGLITGEYGLNFNNDTWSFIIAPEVIDEFYERTISIEDVYRDEANNIATSGTLDPNTKKVRSTVEWSWRGVLHYDIELETYLSNWVGDNWIQTTCTEWSAGTFSNTETGETAAPPDNNCAVMLEVLEGPGNFWSSADAGAHGNDVVVDGNYAYMATARNQEGLSIIDVSDPSEPEEEEDVDVGGKGRGILKEGNYLYMGVEKSTKGLAIVGVSDPENPELESTLNVGGYGNRMDKSGNYLFIGVEDSSNSMKVIDVSNPAFPSVVATLNLGTAVNVVKISGSYAYLGTDDTAAGFQVVDISNPASPNLVYSLNVGGAVSGIDIDGSYADIGLLNTTDAFKVIGISDPLLPIVLNTLDVGAKIQDVKVDGNYAYVALDQNDPGMAAINISDSPNVSLAYTRDIEGKGTSAETSGGYVFFTIDVSNKGLVIIDVSNGSLSTSGDYISTVFDAGSEDIRYNYFTADADVESGGSVTFQIRTASSSSGITSATWVGSDGSSSTSYESTPTPITLDPNASGKRYLQVKATLTSDGVNSSEVESITINYTP